MKKKATKLSIEETKAISHRNNRIVDAYLKFCNKTYDNVTPHYKPEENNQQKGI